MKDKVVTIEFSYKNVLLVTGLVVAAIIAWKIQTVFFMLFISFIISSSLKPVIAHIRERYKISHALSVYLVYLVLALLIIFVLTTIVAQLVHQSSTFFSQAPVLLSNLGELASNIVEKVVSAVNTLPGETFVEPATIKTQILEYFKNSDFSQLFNNGISGAFNVINSALVFLFGVFTVLFISVYMSLREGNVYDGVLNLLPTEQRKKYHNLIIEIEEKLGNWLRGQILLMLAIGALTWVGLIIPGILFPQYHLGEFALLLAVISAFLNAIPNFGPVAGGFIGVLIALGSNPDNPLFPVVYILILFTVIQQIDNAFITPNIMKKAVGLDPIITIVSVVGAFLIFDFFGALFIIPLLAIAQIIIQFSMDEKNWKKQE